MLKMLFSAINTCILLTISLLLVTDAFILPFIVVHRTVYLIFHIICSFILLIFGCSLEILSVYTVWSQKKKSKIWILVFIFDLCQLTLVVPVETSKEILVYNATSRYIEHKQCNHVYQILNLTIQFVETSSQINIVFIVCTLFRFSTKFSSKKSRSNCSMILSMLIASIAALFITKLGRTVSFTIKSEILYLAINLLCFFIISISYGMRKYGKDKKRGEQKLTLFLIMLMTITTSLKLIDFILYILYINHKLILYKSMRIRSFLIGCSIICKPLLLYCCNRRYLRHFNQTLKLCCCCLARNGNKDNVIVTANFNETDIEYNEYIEGNMLSRFINNYNLAVS